MTSQDCRECCNKIRTVAVRCASAGLLHMGPMGRATKTRRAMVPLSSAKEYTTPAARTPKKSCLDSEDTYWANHEANHEANSHQQLCLCYSRQPVHSCTPLPLHDRPNPCQLGQLLPWQLASVALWRLRCWCWCCLLHH